MGPISIGDLARSFNLRLANNRVKAQLDSHSKELVTEVKNDIASALRGDTGYLSEIEARLATLRAHKNTATELGSIADRMQITLESMQSIARSAANDMLSATATPSPDRIAFATQQAKAQFADLVGQVNTRAGGQYLFSGTGITTAPVPAPDTVLDTIRNNIAGAATAEDMLAEIDNFFDAPPGSGGFLDVVYQGSEMPVTTRIAPDTSISLAANAGMEEFRNLIKGMAIATLAGEAPHADDPTSQVALLDAASLALLSGADQITALRGHIGMSEAMIEQAQSRHAAEETALDITRNEIIRVDRYEAATAVAEAEARLEALYSMTARLSRLSLTAYLR